MDLGKFIRGLLILTIESWLLDVFDEFFLAKGLVVVPHLVYL